MHTRASIGTRAWPAVALLLAAFAGPAASQGEASAGRFIAVTGDVQIVGADGVARRATRDGDIRQGESIVTGANSLAQLRMTDGGALSLRSDSQLKLDKYRFAGAEDREASFFVSIVKGGLRTITGLIGRNRRDSYRVTTPSATMGIRGTHFEVVHVPQPLPATPPGTYTRVFDGVIAFQNLKGLALDVRRDQTVFVPIAGVERPVLVAPPAALFGRPTPVPLPPQSRVDDEKKAGVPSPAHKDGTRAVAPGTARELAPATTVAPSRTLSSPLLNPIDTPRVMEVAPTRTTISPTLTSPALISPTTIQTSPTLTAPATTTISPTTTTISPTTTTIQTSPTLISPTTTTISPTTTTISPTTTTSSPTLISPTTIQTAPTTTIQTAPTTTIQTSPTLTSPILTAPTTTIKK